VFEHTRVKYLPNLARPSRIYRSMDGRTIILVLNRCILASLKLKKTVVQDIAICQFVHHEDKAFQPFSFRAIFVALVQFQDGINETGFTDEAINQWG